MQYLEIKSLEVMISSLMPIALLQQAIELIESTEIEANSGTQIEVNLHDGILQVSGEGVISEINPLMTGLEIIREYLDSNVSIKVENQRWETTVSLCRKVH